MWKQTHFDQPEHECFPRWPLTCKECLEGDELPTRTSKFICFLSELSCFIAYKKYMYQSVRPNQIIPIIIFHLWLCLDKSFLFICIIYHLMISFFTHFTYNSMVCFCVFTCILAQSVFNTHFNIKYNGKLKLAFVSINLRPL